MRPAHRQLAFPFIEAKRGIRTRPPGHRRRYMPDRDFSSMYRWYMKSPQWQKKREEALALRGSSCERCGRDGTPHNPMHVHHRNYLRLGYEDVGRDLLILCEECHDLVHAVKDWLDAG
jgi:5-methylcytosine-specific restriction endonuclease McrA